jgi:hypothetical protein
MILRVVCICLLVRYGWATSWFEQLLLFRLPITGNEVNEVGRQVAYFEADGIARLL